MIPKRTQGRFISRTPLFDPAEMESGNVAMREACRAELERHRAENPHAGRQMTRERLNAIFSKGAS